MNRVGSAARIVCLPLIATAVLAGCVTDRAPTNTPPSENYTPEPATQFVHVHGLAVDPGDPTVLFVATHRGLIKGKGDGNWTYAGPDKSDYMGFSLHPTDNRTAWSSGHPSTGGVQGVRKSLDGGVSWQAVALSGQVDCHGMTISRANPDIAYCAHSGGGLYRTTNARDFARVSTGGLLEPVISMATPPESPDVVYAGGPEGLQRSDDGGRLWQTIAGGSQQAATAVAIHPSNASTIYAYILNGRGLQRSADGGATWAQADDGIPEDAVITALAIDPSNPLVLYASAVTTIWKTVDGGDHWNVVRPGDP